MTFRRYNMFGWGAAKTATNVQQGNLVLGVSVGSGYASQQWPSATADQNAIISQMRQAGFSWVRSDCEMWTVQQNGFLLTQPLAAGVSVTQVTVKPHNLNVSGGALIMTAGTKVAISDLLGHSVIVTFTSNQTANTGSTPTTFTVEPFTPPVNFPVNSTMGGPYVWTRPDSFFIPMVTGNGAVTPLNALVLLSQCPAWAMVPINTPPYNAPGLIPDPPHYAAFCAAAVDHYEPYGITAFELWNEPNLAHPTSAFNSNTAMGYLNPIVFCDLATAAYPLMKDANPRCFVVSGTLATVNKFGTGSVDKNSCSWDAVPAGATSATINTADAVAADAIGFLYDNGNNWPVGTVVRSVNNGVSLDVIPPPWMTSGFPTIAAQSNYTGIETMQNCRIAADDWLNAFYTWRNEKHPNAKWGDALGIHPYTWPVLPLTQLAIYGGWRVVPTMRQKMITEGDGHMPMWVTEFGSPTDRNTGASWSTVGSSATSITVSCPQANSSDLGYEVFDTNFPSGSFVGAVSNGASWTILPPTGLVLQTGAALSTASTLTSINVRNMNSSNVTVNAGTMLRLTTPNRVMTQDITCSSTTTINAGANGALPVNSFTPNYNYPAAGSNYHASIGVLTLSPAGTALQGSIGQTWAMAGASSGITAASGVKFQLCPPGTLPYQGANDEDEQATILRAGIKSLMQGEAGISVTYPAIQPWPFAAGAPFFIFNWQDGRDGLFGLLRLDGSQKPSYTVPAQARALGS